MRKRKLSQKYIIGIDEVGRGPLAGPVTVAAVLLPRNFQFSISNFQKKSKLKLKDSKKLSSQQREIWFQWIKKHSNILKNIKMFYAIASVSPKIIDKINISRAANLAATRALARVDKFISYKLVSFNQRKKTQVFLDGGLFIKNSKLINLKTYKLKTIIKGDEKIPAIALASIVAKVTRDRMMEKLHKKYLKYGFDKHKGYGTKQHFKMIKKHGLSPIHRKSFRIK